MTPTLIGRIQTRIVLLALVGSAVTAVVTPFLAGDGPLGARYGNTFLVLATVLVLGVGWEAIYHFLMQWRWEKDWPTLFGLVTLLPEGALVWALLLGGAVPGIRGPLTLSTFAVHFLAVWIAVWLAMNGPLRAPLIRWRFQGGRFI